jgi:hypothetical protein
MAGCIPLFIFNSAATLTNGAAPQPWPNQSGTDFELFDGVWSAPVFPAGTVTPTGNLSQPNPLIAQLQSSTGGKYYISYSVNYFGSTATFARTQVFVGSNINPNLNTPVASAGAETTPNVDTTISGVGVAILAPGDFIQFTGSASSGTGALADVYSNFCVYQIA